ncbi:hypothetical protein [Azohydromonas caseinilytica]|uniref:Uncharacterized protein n=1 Tax=Azohydromonas caseinilytica TaxID=2728836 RepID=A0A848F4X6_9BURK|nr:hypothetical protein [Azohydromonas caseinilytica]NML13686.1 hypothetical protein [Azohydromonas caseinilytica]
MPAPTASQLESATLGFLQGAGLRGEDAPGLAKAIAASTAQTLTLLLSMAMVQPGIPAPCDPISGSGATAGPGLLMPPPAGGPGASQLEGLVNGFLAGQGIRGEDANPLGKALAAGLAQAVQLFTALAMVLPGIAIAGFVTTAPGMLAPVPLQSQLKPLLDGFLQQNGIRGEDAPALAQAAAQAIDLGFTLFAAQAMVSPGIACAPGASAAPGRLM